MVECRTWNAEAAGSSPAALTNSPKIFTANKPLTKIRGEAKIYLLVELRRPPGEIRGGFGLGPLKMPIKAYALDESTGRHFDMIEVAPGDFVEVSKKHPDLVGVPMFYTPNDSGYFFKCWPNPQRGFTAHFDGETSSFVIESPVVLIE